MSSPLESLITKKRHSRCSGQSSTGWGWFSPTGRRKRAAFCAEVSSCRRRWWKNGRWSDWRWRCEGRTLKRCWSGRYVRLPPSSKTRTVNESHGCFEYWRKQHEFLSKSQRQQPSERKALKQVRFQKRFEANQKTDDWDEINQDSRPTCCHIVILEIQVYSRIENCRLSQLASRICHVLF